MGGAAGAPALPRLQAALQYWKHALSVPCESLTLFLTCEPLASGAHGIFPPLCIWSDWLAPISSHRWSMTARQSSMVNASPLIWQFESSIGAWSPAKLHVHAHHQCLSSAQCGSRAVCSSVAPQWMTMERQVYWWRDRTCCVHGYPPHAAWKHDP